MHPTIGSSQALSAFTILGVSGAPMSASLRRSSSGSISPGSLLSSIMAAPHMQDLGRGISVRVHYLGGHGRRAAWPDLETPQLPSNQLPPADLASSRQPIVGYFESATVGPLATGRTTGESVNALPCERPPANGADLLASLGGPRATPRTCRQ